MKNLNSAALKNHQVKIKQVENSIKSLEAKRSLVQSELSTKHKELNVLQHELNKAKRSTLLVVSEHAMLRYLERVYKLDLEKLHLEIVPVAMRESILELGSGNYCVDSRKKLKGKKRTLGAKISSNTPITTLPNTKPNHTTSRKIPKPMRANPIILFIIYFIYHLELFFNILS